MSDRSASRRRSPSRSPDDRRRYRSSRSRSPNDRRRETSDPSHRSTKLSFRDELNLSKYIPLKQYQAEYKANKYAHLTVQDKIRMFNTKTMPILAPLAPGETEEQYEIRFHAYLRRFNFTLEQLRASSDLYQERNLRIEFSNQNAMGYERFEDFDWSKDATKYRPESRRSLSTDRKKKQEPTIKKTDTGIDKPPTSRREISSGTVEEDKLVPQPVCPSKHPEVRVNLTSTAIVEAYLTCGCMPCLFAVMNGLSQQLDQIEATATIEQAKSVVDLTQVDDGESPKPTTSTTTTHSIAG